MQGNVNTVLLCAFWPEFWGYVIAQEQGTVLNSSKTCSMSCLQQSLLEEIFQRTTKKQFLIISSPQAKSF